MNKDDINFPEERHNEIDVVYLSPPWGGTGYNLMKEYSISYIYPDFDSLMQKSLEFSNNLILFLPRNTSVDEIIDRLC